MQCARPRSPTVKHEEGRPKRTRLDAPAGCGGDTPAVTTSGAPLPPILHLARDNPPMFPPRNGSVARNRHSRRSFPAAAKAPRALEMACACDPYNTGCPNVTYLGNIRWTLQYKELQGVYWLRLRSTWWRWTLQTHSMSCPIKSSSGSG